MNLKQFGFLSLAMLLYCSQGLWAQDEQDDEQEAAAVDAELAVPPPLPPKVQDSDEELEPTVTITTEEDKVIEEYSYNGRVYLVKVTPAHGEPYYYRDVDGDGQLELQGDDDALHPVQPVLWKVKEW